MKPTKRQLEAQIKDFERRMSEPTASDNLKALMAHLIEITKKELQELTTTP